MFCKRLLSLLDRLTSLLLMRVFITAFTPVSIPEMFSALYSIYPLASLSYMGCFRHCIYWQVTRSWELSSLHLLIDKSLIHDMFSSLHLHKSVIHNMFSSLHLLRQVSPSQDVFIIAFTQTKLFTRCFHHCIVLTATTTRCLLTPLQFEAPVLSEAGVVTGATSRFQQLSPGCQTSGRCYDEQN